MLLHHKLVSTYPELKSSDQLAIVSPYREPVERLKQRFRSTYGVEFEKLVEITTVDGCQVPNKDFDSFFSDENMKSFAVKEESSSTEAVRNDDVDNYAPSDNLWDVDQAQEDDNDFGGGDMDMDMDNASCSDD